MWVPPKEPRTRKAEAQDRDYLNYEDLDGLIIDSLKATPLHMPFTGFILPIDIGSRGLRNTQIYFPETVISVHDKGQGIGDLAAIPVRNSPIFRLIQRDRSCNYDLKGNTRSAPHIISIDGWRGFFDRPAEPTVFRAKGNWMARLAVTTVSVTQGNLTLLHGDHIYCNCREEEHERLKHKPKPLFSFFDIWR